MKFLRLSHFMLLVLFISAPYSKAAISDVLPVPDSESYQAFLLEEWEPSQPSIIVMLDPFCPYCIRTLKQRERLRKYNVFLFWSPILGPGSEKRVAKILNCARPAGTAAISSVIAGEAPECGDSDSERFSRNNNMVEKYAPNSVPAYYFGGTRVSLNQLKLYIEDLESISGTASVEWDRYSLLKVNQTTNGLGEVGVILPSNFDDWEDLVRVISSSTQFQWYIFPNAGEEKHSSFCSLIKNCDSIKGSDILRRRLEVELLLVFQS